MTWATAYGLTRLDDPHRVNLMGPTSTGLNRYYAVTTEARLPTRSTRPPPTTTTGQA